MLLPVASEKHPDAVRLRERLDAFYGTTEDYLAFGSRSNQSACWHSVKARIRERTAGPGDRQLRVLEFGAGWSGFPAALGDLRPKVHLTLQDVTDRHRESLGPEIDAFHVGDLSQLDGTFDVIFSTYAWEHVSNPEATFAALLARVAPGGSLFLFGPRYDFPGYLPPSVRRSSLATRLAAYAWLPLVRLVTLLTRRPGWWIHFEPAVFHATWYPDADAIHWVSRFDIRAALPRGWHLSNAPMPPTRSLMRKFYEAAMLLRVEIHRPGERGQPRE
jgi:SAM-dependent methyltransferase